MSEPKHFPEVREAILEELVHTFSHMIETEIPEATDDHLFNEQRLYEALGKEDARTVLAVHAGYVEAIKLARIAAVVIQPTDWDRERMNRWNVQAVVDDIVEKAIAKHIQSVERLIEYRRKVREENNA